MAESQVLDRPIIVVSNRGPVSYHFNNGAVESRRGGGGLVAGLGQLIDSGQATWIAATLSDADRKAVRSGVVTDEFPNVKLLDIEPNIFDKAYNKIANETLWFIHHSLFNLSITPSFGHDWWDAWAAYRLYNNTFAQAVIDIAPSNATVLIQDYHLCLLAPLLKQQRPDLCLVHFHHTPFGGPESFRVLPPAAREELISSLAAHDICAFHVQPWADQFTNTLKSNGVDSLPHVITTTLTSHLPDLLNVAESKECTLERQKIEKQRGDRQLIVRVDRFELSKNILRGFEAFDRLLMLYPKLRGKVTFLACCYPSREAVTEYRRYREEVERFVEMVNEKFGTQDWQPIILETTDNFPRSVAALQLYDVLLVNPIRDGLNLVAKEGPVVNQQHGQLVLSTEAGAYHELRDVSVVVHPFDIEQTAVALHDALTMEAPEREQRAGLLKGRATHRTPADWLEDQLAAVRAING